MTFEKETFCMRTSIGITGRPTTKPEKAVRKNAVSPSIHH
jgi:hypothetical protein